MGIADKLNSTRDERSGDLFDEDIAGIPEQDDVDEQSTAVNMNRSYEVDLNNELDVNMLAPDSEEPTSNVEDAEIQTENHVPSQATDQGVSDVEIEETPSSETTMTGGVESNLEAEEQNSDVSVVTGSPLPNEDVEQDEEEKDKDEIQFQVKASLHEQSLTESQTEDSDIIEGSRDPDIDENNESEDTLTADETVFSEATIAHQQVKQEKTDDEVTSSYEPNDDPDLQFNGIGETVFRDWTHRLSSSAVQQQISEQIDNIKNPLRHKAITRSLQPMPFVKGVLGQQYKGNHYEYVLRDDRKLHDHGFMGEFTGGNHKRDARDALKFAKANGWHQITVWGSDEYLYELQQQAAKQSTPFVITPIENRDAYLASRQMLNMSSEDRFAPPEKVRVNPIPDQKVPHAKSEPVPPPPNIDNQLHTMSSPEDFKVSEQSLDTMPSKSKATDSEPSPGKFDTKKFVRPGEAKDSSLSNHMSKRHLEMDTVDIDEVDAEESKVSKQQFDHSSTMINGL